MSAIADAARRLLAYDPETGALMWRAPDGDLARTGRPRAYGKPAGQPARGQRYGHIWLDGRLHKTHRVVWLLHYGEWPSGMIDHINGNPSDNSIANLRLASASQNQANACTRSDNRLGVKGVRQRGQMFEARCRAAGKLHRVGLFSTLDAAKAARDAFAARVHGEFMRP